jgi:4-diphosphocytidyl-2-C-methyl-D-erythritol kinase
MPDLPLVWPAPAKLNLMLHITGQRADGYHELQTVFQFLDAGDELRFEARNDGEINRVQGAKSVVAEGDLTVRAAHALQQISGCPLGVDIHLRKHLPIGAGLGGGSSDAATTLHALNRLWKLGLDKQELADIGLKLGADVPVFVHGFAAFAEGVGEKLTAVDIEQPWYLVITPHVHVSTAEIFQDLELTRDCPTIKIRDLPASGWENVCLPVVMRRYPLVKEAMEELGRYAKARMSGTGASVFAAFDSEAEAQAVRSKLPEAWSGFVAKGLNESPLAALLKQL